MQSRLILLTALPLLALGQQITTAYFIKPLGTDVPVAASIINVNSALTTYALGCGPDFPPEIPEGKKEDICPTLSQITATQGSNTLAYTTQTDYGDSGAAPTMLKAAMNCNLQGTTQAVCTNSFDGVEKISVPTGLDPEIEQQYKARIDAMKTPEVATYTGAEMPPMGIVAVTAGAEKLAAPTSVMQPMTSSPYDKTGSGNSISVEVSPAEGGINTTVPRTHSESAYVTPTGASNTSSVSPSTTGNKTTKATSTSKSTGSSIDATYIPGFVFGIALLGLLYL